MKKLNFLHILVVAILFFILLTYLYFYKTQEIAMHNAQTKVSELLLNYQALRTNVSKSQKKEIYRLQNLGIIDSEYFHSSVLSSTYNAKQVNVNYNKLRKQLGKQPIIIKFASANPRNLNNQATKKEIEILKKFNTNEIEHYTERIKIDNKEFLYDAIPTKRTTPKCMKCHSDPSSAPKDLVDMYGDKNGFYEEVGQIRALLATTYPLEKDLDEANDMFIVLTTITFVLVSILLIIIFIFMKRINLSNQQLDEKVLLRTRELNELLSIFDKGETVLFKWNNDDKWSVNHVSLNVYQLLEYKDTDFYTNQISYEDCIFNEDLEVVRQEVIEASKLSANDYFQHKPYRVVTKTGKIKWVLDSSLIIRDKSNNIINYLGHIIDITDLKNKEDMLYKSEKMASMGEMIGNIAHQWRQPLSVISTASTSIIMQKEYGMLTDEILNDSCNKINDNAQYLSKTIDDFKNFIKGDRTKKLFSLKNGIDSFLNLVEGSIKDNNINMILDLQEDIKIDGYENELTQCLINIFNNAKDILKEKISTNEDRLIFITTSTTKDKAIIKIKDSGGGIPKDILPKVFEPYFTTKHKSQGTGLGLHMTYNLIVDGMNGTVEATNDSFEYGGKNYTGAEFIITLPIF